MNNDAQLKQLVKEKYSEIAKQPKDQNLASCCGATAACCGDDVYNIMADDYTRLEGYNPDADLGLGCGLPTEFAKIEVGDTVIDLGSGAGFSGFGLITELDADQFRSVVDVCLTGAFLVIKHAGRHLGEGGSLVSLTSLNGRQPAIGMSAYCSAKAGLSMLTQVAALELGPHGVRVNAVAPGFVHTPLTEGAMAIPGVVEDYVENTALGRTGTPEDIAAAVAFLCSPQSAWLTGEVLDLNGGAHLKRYPNIHQHLTKLMGQ